MLSRTHIWTLLTLITCLTGCFGGQPDVAFDGIPPEVPDQYHAPATAQIGHEALDKNAKEELKRRDLYPCTAHTVCQYGSPKDGVLRLASAIPHSIDPGFASDTAGQLVVENLFEGLVVPGVSSGPPEPGVAERWSVSADNRVYTFHLRKDARWSNGRSVTAEDFRYTWLRNLKPETASRSASVFLHIKGAKDFNRGVSRDPDSVGIKTVNEHTLRITLEAGMPHFLEYVRQIHYCPVPKEAIDAHGKLWTRPEHIVTNGAYHLEKWVHRGKFRLKKSETYWGRENVRITDVDVSLGSDSAAGWTKYQQQSQHVVMDVPSALVSKFHQENRPDFFIDSTNCYVDIAFNLTHPVLSDRKLRQAFAMSIDKERLSQHILGGLRTEADGPVPSHYEGQSLYQGSNGLPFDPERARELLEKAGYPNGNGLPPLTMVHNTSPNHVQVATFVQRTLHDNLGVKVELRALEPKTLFATIRKKDFQLARYARCATNHPYAFLEEFRTDSKHNHYSYANTSFDELLDTSMKAGNELERMKALSLAERHLQRDLPNIPLYFGARSYLKVPVLRGWGPESGNSHLIKYMYWGDKENKPL